MNHNSKHLQDKVNYTDAVDGRYYDAKWQENICEMNHRRPMSLSTMKQTKANKNTYSQTPHAPAAVNYYPL